MKTIITLLILTFSALAHADLQQCIADATAACEAQYPPPEPEPEPECKGAANMETVDLGNPGKSKWIDLTGETLITRLKTTTSPTLAGVITAVPGTGQTGVGRRFWISDCPAGKVLDQEIPGPSGPVKKCLSKGTVIQLQWSQAINPGYDCRLEPGRTYYLNQKNVKHDEPSRLKRDIGSNRQ